MYIINYQSEEEWFTSEMTNTGLEPNIFEDALAYFYMSNLEEFEMPVTVEIDRHYEADCNKGDAYVIGNNKYGFMNIWVVNPLTQLYDN